MTASSEIVVLTGGVSSERDISLITGKAVVSALKSCGYKVRTIDTRKSLDLVVRELSPPPFAVFNALHGRFGEDGVIQGLLELLQIPYTHSGVLASALAMDKPTAKKIFKSEGIRCAEHRIVDIQQILDSDVLPPPYVIKPVNEGSSFGVQIIKSTADLSQFKNEDWAFDKRIMVEKYIEGRELTVTVMGERALGVTELRPTTQFYDFNAKYIEGKTEHILPADLPNRVTEITQQYALTAHKTLGCRGITRADFRYDEKKPGASGVYLLELNTQPGLTPLSLVPEQAAHAGISFPELINWMVENASCGD